MLYGFELSATGSSIERARMENVSNNLANVETVGFKNDLLTVMERPPESRTWLVPEQSARAMYSHDLLDRLGGGAWLAQTYHDHSHGAPRATGNPFDFALTGEGFFAVEAPVTGEKFYTRAGNFRMNDEGMLVTNEGAEFVLDRDGRRINIGNMLAQNAGAGFAVNTEGRVTIEQDGGGMMETNTYIGVSLFDADAQRQLEKAGNSRFRPMRAHIHDEARQLTRIAANERHRTGRVMQGFVEMSGADPIRLMNNMVEVNRSFERNLNLLSLQNGTLQELIGRVGQPV